MRALPLAIRVVDSHTAGEPTRIVVAGGPDLGTGSLADRVERFRKDFDRFRSGIVNEPRGSDVLVGGLVCEPVDRTCSAGVIFFNNQGYLGMCGHGLIGLLVTLQYLEKINPGEHRIETPVGTVTAQLKSSGEVSLQNVPSYRFQTGVELDVPGYGLVVGDIAWGGNWFFLAEPAGIKLRLSHVVQLTAFAKAIRSELNRHSFRGLDGTSIDHIEFFGAAEEPGNHGRNFVLCPGGAYDRSPCGTGTSAKLSCLAAEGRLKPGQLWRQESIIGTVFTASYRECQPGEFCMEGVNDPAIIPSISGQAYICAESMLRFDPRDPFAYGIVS